MSEYFCDAGPRRAYGYEPSSLPLFDGEVIVRVASYYAGRDAHYGWAVGYNLARGEVFVDDPVEVFFYGNDEENFAAAREDAISAAKVLVLRAHCNCPW